MRMDEIAASLGLENIALKEQRDELLTIAKAWVCMYEDKGEVPPEARVAAYIASIKAINRCEGAADAMDGGSSAGTDAAT